MLAVPIAPPKISPVLAAKNPVFAVLCGERGDRLQWGRHYSEVG